MKKFVFALLVLPVFADAQQKWKNVDAEFGPLPASVHVWYTDNPIDTAPFKAYYLIADLNDKQLLFETDTTKDRRLTPQQFYQKNQQPIVVVNGTFFSFETNRNLNSVIKDGRLISFNAMLKGRGKDSVLFFPSFRSAIGIRKNRTADVAWLKTDSSSAVAFASQKPLTTYLQSRAKNDSQLPKLKKWKMHTAIGGGPVLLQQGDVAISNEEEKMFAGKAINDKHPRTAMGYTADGKLIILVVEGRNPTASGATLIQEAQLLKDLGCVEALNLDGGGSSCLLINGKETIKPSDKEGQRAVPAVFMIQRRN